MDCSFGNEDGIKKTYPISQTDSSRYIAAPTISSLTLVSNWDNDAEESLKCAVDKLVAINPILTGHLVKDNDKNQLKVVSETHSNFFSVINGPENFFSFKYPIYVHENV